MPSGEFRTGQLSSGSATVDGYAAVYDQWTQIGGAFMERLRPGCFRMSMQEEPDILALWHHKWEWVLGRTTSGTLRLFDEAKGLRFELDLDERTPDGARALGTVERGDVAGCSLLMQPTVEEWEDTGTGLPRRTIVEAWLYEITLTPIPAYPQTSVMLTGAQNNANARRRRAEAAMRMRGISV